MLISGIFSDSDFTEMDKVDQRDIKNDKNSMLGWLVVLWIYIAFRSNTATMKQEITNLW